MRQRHDSLRWQLEPGTGALGQTSGLHASSDGRPHDRACASAAHTHTHLRPRQVGQLLPSQCRLAMRAVQRCTEPSAAVCCQATCLPLPGENCWGVPMAAFAAWSHCAARSGLMACSELQGHTRSPLQKGQPDSSPVLALTVALQTWGCWQVELGHCHCTCLFDPRVTCSGRKALPECHCCARCSSGGPAAATLSCFVYARLAIAHLGQAEPLLLPAPALLKIGACQL